MIRNNETYKHVPTRDKVSRHSEIKTVKRNYQKIVSKVVRISFVPPSTLYRCETTKHLLPSEIGVKNCFGFIHFEFKLNQISEHCFLGVPTSTTPCGA